MGVLVEKLTALCAPQQSSVGKSRLPEWHNTAGTQYRNCLINFNIAHTQNACVCLLAQAGTEPRAITVVVCRVGSQLPDGLHVWAVPMTTCMKTEMRYLQGSL